MAILQFQRIPPPQVVDVGACQVLAARFLDGAVPGVVDANPVVDPQIPNVWVFR